MLAAGATLAVEIDVDATPDADLLDVVGTINLGGATLDLTRLNTPPLVASPATFLIARNDSSDPITGTFAAITGLPPELVGRRSTTPTPEPTSSAASARATTWPSRSPSPSPARLLLAAAAIADRREFRRRA